MMSAYSVMDSVNKYRHGVLLGNYVEDKFGRDLNEKGANQDARKLPTTKDFHDPSHSLYQPHSVIKEKEQRNEPYYVTAKGISQENYKKPENETSYNIFHRQQVTQQVPVLANNPKRQEKMEKDGDIYNNTRYYLSNKFGNQKETQLKTNSNLDCVQNLRETGNIYNIDDQEIPDILTGEIWKAPNKKPDADTKVSSKHTGEPMTKVQTMKKPRELNPYCATSLIRPTLQKFDEEEYKKKVFHNERGEEHNVLFGHGLDINEFHRNQLCTTYDLSHNQRVPPQTQVNSFYNVDSSQAARKYHRDTVFEKNHQTSIPEFGTKQPLGQQKWGRPYDPYTKTYDKNHLKNEYLRN